MQSKRGLFLLSILMLSSALSVAHGEQYFTGERFATYPSDDISIQYLSFKVGNKIFPHFSVEARGNIAMSESHFGLEENTGYVVGLYSKFIACSTSATEPYFVLGFDRANNLSKIDAWWYHGDPTDTSEMNIGAGIEYSMTANMRMVSELLHQEGTSSNSLSIGFAYSF